jgi:hypothetical protein
MPRSIPEILEAVGPSRSSVVVDVLHSDGLSWEAARQKVSRVSGPVRRLGKLRFPNREKFLFLSEQEQTALLYTGLEEALVETGTCFGVAIKGLLARDGAVPSRYFPIVSGQPSEPTKGHVLSSFIEEQLLEVGLLNKSSSAIGEILSLWNCSGLSSRRRAVMEVESIVLSSFRSWLAKVGWTSSSAPTMRSAEKPLPMFGQFAWDLVGPCYLSSVVSGGKGKLLNGFVCADILLDRVVNLDDLKPFLMKWDILRAQRRATRFQPIFVADSFEEDALRQLRERGCFVAIPSTVFGEDIARGLRDLIGTIENAAAAVVNNPGAVFELIGKLSKIEGAALNLRGVALELFVGHLFQTDGYSIDIRQQIKDSSGKFAEIDIKATKKSEVICCECKGKAPGNLVTKEEIDDWMRNSVPRIKDWMKNHPSLPEKKRFQFYASTDYSDEASKEIEKIQNSHKRQPIEFLKGTDVLSKMSGMKLNSLANMFREHFST